ncbi:MAG: TetR/AcrR family transcriptional regulator [Fibrobacterota bacterium]
MSPSRGRPRLYDSEQALDAATRIFWARGYEGTSINELVETTGLNKPSLYAAFGDKEALYLAVVERYAASLEKIQRDRMDSEPDVWVALEGLLRDSAQALSDPQLPGGCLVVTGLAECGTPHLPESAEKVLREALDGTGTAILDRLRRGRKERQILPELDLGALAEAISTWMAGMAIRAKSGAGNAVLEDAIDSFVSMWPRTVSGSPGSLVKKPKRSVGVSTSSRTSPAG